MRKMHVRKQVFCDSDPPGGALYFTTRFLSVCLAVKVCSVIKIEYSYYSSFAFALTDIQECSNPSLNKCQQICNNAIGSYTCSCHAGFTPNVDGFKCNGTSLQKLR